MVDLKRDVWLSLKWRQNKSMGSNFIGEIIKIILSKWDFLGEGINSYGSGYE